MITETVTIVNRLGLHARAATRLVNRASEFDSSIWLDRDQRSVNAKSIMGVLTLAAATGTELTVKAEGPDEDAALAAVTELIRNGFGEDD